MLIHSKVEVDEKEIDVDVEFNIDCDIETNVSFCSEYKVYDMYNNIIDDELTKEQHEGILEQCNNAIRGL